MADANARLLRQFSQAAPSDRIVIGIARSDILIAIAAHRSAAARVESPRRRDCVPVSSPYSPHPGAPCKHYPITNGLIEAPVDLRPDITKGARLEDRKSTRLNSSH